MVSRTWQGIAAGPVGDVGAVRQARRALDPERPEDRLLGGAGRPAVVLGHDQLRQPERIGQEDELLAQVVALVADRGQELDARHPLRLGQLDLAGKAVEVAEKAGHDLAEAGVRAVVPAADGLIGDGVLVQVDHWRGLLGVGLSGLARE